MQLPTDGSRRRADPEADSVVCAGEPDDGTRATRKTHDLVNPDGAEHRRIERCGRVDISALDRDVIEHGQQNIGERDS